jgi:hypothetical protein
VLKLGQGRAMGKSPLDLACILVFRSHGHHLRGVARAHERDPPDPRARRRAILAVSSCTPRRRLRRAERPGKRPGTHLVRQCRGLVQSGSLTGGHHDHLMGYRRAFGQPPHGLDIDHIPVAGPVSGVRPAPR